MKSFTAAPSGSRNLRVVSAETAPEMQLTTFDFFLVDTSIKHGKATECTHCASVHGRAEALDNCKFAITESCDAPEHACFRQLFFGGIPYPGNK